MRFGNKKPSLRTSPVIKKYRKHTKKLQTNNLSKKNKIEFKRIDDKKTYKLHNKKKTNLLKRKNMFIKSIKRIFRKVINLIRK